MLFLIQAEIKKKRILKESKMEAKSGYKSVCYVLYAKY